MKAREAGFTLLEIIVALAVFGLILLGLAESWQFGLAAWRGGVRAAVEPEGRVAVDMALTRLIEQAQPGSMVGRAGGMAFTTRLPAGSGVAGLADVAVQMTPGGDLELSYRAHPAGVPLVALPRVAAEPLVKGVDQFSVSYLAAKPGMAASWSGVWRGEGLPLLVRLHIHSAGSGDWPDLIAAPMGAAR